MNWKPELDDLARREAFAREMGGVDKVKRQHDQGRLTVRERIDRLIDKNSFHEIGAISGIAEYDENSELKHLTPANCVFGRGKIDHSALVTNADAATVAAIIAKDHFQDRRFTRAGRAGQHHAFARLDVKRDATHDRQFDPALQMHGEGLFGAGDVDHRCHCCAHAGKIEETSSWV